MTRGIKSLFFKFTGFENGEDDIIINKTSRVKRALKQIKARKRTEKRLINESKFKPCGPIPNCNKKTKQQKVTEQIDRGYEVARRLNND